MSTLDVQPAPAAEPTSAIPIAQQVEALTPEQARTRLSGLHPRLRMGRAIHGGQAGERAKPIRSIRSHPQSGRYAGR